MKFERLDKMLGIAMKAASWCMVVLVFALFVQTASADTLEAACFTNLKGKAAFTGEGNEWGDDKISYTVRLLVDTETEEWYIEGWEPGECVVLPHTNFAMLCGRGTVGRYELWSVANGLVHFVRTTNDGLGGFTAVLAMTGTYEEC